MIALIPFLLSCIAVPAFATDAGVATRCVGGTGSLDAAVVLRGATILSRRDGTNGPPRPASVPKADIDQIVAKWDRTLSASRESFAMPCSAIGCFPADYRLWVEAPSFAQSRIIASTRQGGARVWLPKRAIPGGSVVNGSPASVAEPGDPAASLGLLGFAARRRLA